MYIKISKIQMLAVVVVFVGSVAAQDIEDRAKKILDSPGIVEQFKKNEGQRNRQNGDKTAPLVKQAREFALYLDPPAPPPPRNVPKAAPNVVRPIAQVSSNFELLGTGCYPAKPEQSIALIDEPGKGLRWVREGDSIGHFKVDQIKDGLIVIDDGRGPQEVFVKKTPHINLVTSSTIEGDQYPSPQQPALSMEPPALSEEQQARQAELIEKLFEKVSAEGNDVSPEEIEALMGELDKIGPEEANQIDKLGETLDQNQPPQPEAEVQPEPEPAQTPARALPSRTRPSRTRRLTR